MVLKRLIVTAVASACVVASRLASAQVSAEEHAKHHPSQQATSASPSATGQSPAPGPASSGMMGEMGEMMKGMHGPPAKQLYPTLMSLPNLSPEQRQKVEQQADEQMRSGTALMRQALDELAQAQASSNYTAMHDATLKLHEGMAQFDSGTAARRALAEGKPPSTVALDWFKREMSLTRPGTGEEQHRGLSLFHLLTMTLLIAFAVAMLAMYFFKMRRAAALFGRIESDRGSPPPGSAAPLGGGSGPPLPPRGKGPSGRVSPPVGPPGAASLAGEAPPPASSEKPPTSASTENLPNGKSAAAARASPMAPPSSKWVGYLRVQSIVVETPSVKTFRLGSLNGGALPFTFIPGQFLNVAFFIGGARMIRSYSISSSPNERDYVELTIKREDRGAVSRHIDDLLEVGDRIEAGGPVGTFTFTGAEAKSIVLISAGVGITPMMSIARYLTDRSWSGDIFFVHSCRSPTDFIFREAIAELERRNPKLHLVVTMSKAGPQWKGPRGRVTKELLTQAVADLTSRRVHICGPVPMMDATKALLWEIGVAPENVKTEQFGAIKPPLGVPSTTAKAVPPATGPMVTFSKSNKSARIGIDLTGEQAALDTGPLQTILELSEQLGIGINFSCRIGTCGVCKVRMTSGEVTMAVQDALDDDDKASGVILACQAKPTTNVVVEA